MIKKSLILATAFTLLMGLVVYAEPSDKVVHEATVISAPVEKKVERNSEEPSAGENDGNQTLTIEEDYVGKGRKLEEGQMGITSVDDKIVSKEPKNGENVVTGVNKSAETGKVTKEYNGTNYLVSGLLGGIIIFVLLVIILVRKKK